MKIEKFHNVDKAWGEEIWLVNNEKYCAKLLVIDAEAESSYHHHEQKQETFYCFEGFALLDVEGKEYKLAPFLRPKTVFPNENHRFKGITSAVILEVSTHHDEADVVRLSDSTSGEKSEA